MHSSYSHEIALHLMDLEHDRYVSPFYMHTQDALEPVMRSKCVEWLAAMVFEMKCERETLHLSVRYMDRYLSKVRVERHRLQLVAATCMFVASKYEDTDPLSVAYISDATNAAVSEDDILATEAVLLNTLEFRLSPVTACALLHLFCAQTSSTRSATHVSEYLVDLFLADYASLQHPPSAIAAAAMLVTRRLLKYVPLWTPKHETCTGHIEERLHCCASRILYVLRMPGTDDDAAVTVSIRKEYGRHQRSEAARLANDHLDAVPW